MTKTFSIFRFTAFIILLLPTSLFCESDEIGAANAFSKYLHVIAFESTDVKDLIPHNEYRISTLKSADLPVRLSQSYFPASTSEKVRASEVGLTGNAGLLDICTFRLTDKEINLGKQFKRENGLCKLRYSAKIRNWLEDTSEIEFSANNFGKTAVKLSKATTTLIRVGRFSFAFTFLDAAFKTDKILSSTERPDGRIAPPKLIKKVPPEYPPGLIRARSEGIFYFLGIIESDGTLNQLHGIVLECLHWLFARNAIEVMLRDWRFVPAQMDGHPVPSIATIEVSYQLRR
jgi:hypothetical protein